MQEIFYFDENNRLTSKDKAKKYIIKKSDKNGILISETRGIINSVKDKYEITKEEYDYLLSIGKKPDEGTFKII